MTQIGSEKKGKALKNHSAISKILLLLLCSEATLPWPVVTITLDMNHHPNSRQRSTIITDHLQNLACALRWYCSGVCLLACPIQLGSPTALIILGPWSKLVWLEFIQVLFFSEAKRKEDGSPVALSLGGRICRNSCTIVDHCEPEWGINKCRKAELN